MTALNPIIIAEPVPRRTEPGVDLRWPASAIWRAGEPKVNRIGFDDLKDVLAKGVDDFFAMPSHMVFLAIFYPLMGLVLCRLLFGYEMLPLVFPIVAGFALLGPFAAVGLYELSRRREAGHDASAKHALDVLRSPSIWAIARLGLVLVAIFLAWVATADVMYRQIMGGPTSASLGSFLDGIFRTEAGWRLIWAGNAVGFAFAALALVISVVSFPLLVDQNVSAATAVRTSVRAVIENPVTMAAWGLIVAVALALGSLPLFFGLAFVLPVLGHATWHLYRRVVSRDETL